MRGFYCFLVGFSWAAVALYVGAGLGALPPAWITSTLTASLLWLALELRDSIRAAERGHRLRPVLLALGHWVGFFIAWAVLAQLLYMFVSNTLADEPPTTVWDWITLIGVCALGLAAIAAITLTRPEMAAARRSRRPPRAQETSSIRTRPGRSAVGRR